MLDELVRYARAQGLDTEPGFKPKDVRWAVACDKEGHFLEVVELGETEQKRNLGRTFSKCPDLSQPELVSGSVTRSHFLVDTAEVVALHTKTPNDAKLIAKHLYFIRSLEEAAEVMPELAALADLLKDETSLQELRNSLEGHRARPADKVTFQIGGAFPLECDEWHDWWRAQRQSLHPPEARTRPGPLVRCLATGDFIQPVATHPKIEKLSDVGGLPTGDVLIGFDKESFCSYGLSQAANAPVSEEVAAAYRAALNALIKEHGQRLAGTKVVQS